jgi:hypothetical protein
VLSLLALASTGCQRLGGAPIAGVDVVVRDDDPHARVSAQGIDRVGTGVRPPQGIDRLGADAWPVP